MRLNQYFMSQYGVQVSVDIMLWSEKVLNESGKVLSYSLFVRNLMHILFRKYAAHVSSLSKQAA